MKTLVPAALAAASLLLATTTPTQAETKVGTTVESRLILALKAPDAAVQAMLPEGWTSLTLPKGPLAGANILVTLMDRHLILDPEGKPEDPSSGPTAALFTYAVKEGEKGPRGFVVRTYEEPPLSDPYSTSAEADIERVSTFEDGGAGARAISETWTITPVAGGEIKVQLNSNLGGYIWATDQTVQPYSATVPEFSRIYRYDQLLTPLKSKAAGLDLTKDVTLTLNDPALASLFDGSEALIAILYIPQYAREVSLP